MCVKINRGAHRHPIPDGIEKMVEGLLIRSGYDPALDWVVYMGAAVRGRPEIPRIKVGKLTHHRSIELRLRPGDNTTARVCYLRPPKNSGILVEDLFMVLKGEQDKPAPARPLPRDNQPDDNLGGKASSLILAEFCSDEDQIRDFLNSLWPPPIMIQKLETDLVGKTIQLVTDLELDERQLRQAIKKLVNARYLERVPKSHGQFLRLGAEGNKLMAPVVANKPPRDAVPQLPAFPVALEPEPVVAVSSSGPLPGGVESAISQELSELEQKLAEFEERARLIEEEARPVRERHAKLTEALHLLS